MKKEVHPALIVVTLVFVVGIVGFLLYKATKPAYYIPSPGAGGRPNTGVPSYAKAPGDAGSSSTAQQPAMTEMQKRYLGSSGSQSPVVPPANSTPGDPHSLKH